MKFNVKDIKSWANRHDIKIGDIGFVACVTNELTSTKAIITEIIDDTSKCFVAQPLNGKVEFQYSFFLPLSAVKVDKPKKYQPFKSMAEFTKVVYNLVPDYLNITGVGESFTVRRKYNGHYEKVLITHLEYDENHELLSINGQSLRDLFENYDIVTDDSKIIPFGIEVEND